MNNSTEQTALADRIWWTSRARIYAEKRHLSNHFHSQLILLYYSFLSTSVAIYYLKFNTASDIANVSWVIFSLLTMIASIFISTLRYRERAESIKQCYEKLISLSHIARTMVDSNQLERVRIEYESVRTLCENHTTFDFDAAVVVEYFRCPPTKRSALTIQPTLVSIINFILKNLVKMIALLAIYSLPICILLILSSCDSANTCIAASL